MIVVYSQYFHITGMILFHNRLGVIEGVGGDTGVKPQHRYVTCID